jgi:hypothetical protein
MIPARAEKKGDMNNGWHFIWEDQNTLDGTLWTLWTEKRGECEVAGTI